MLKSKQRQEGSRKPRARKPLAEGLQEIRTRRDFTEAELAHIKKRYGELSAKSMTTWHISKEIARRMERSTTCVNYKIIQLIKQGELEENPNQKRSRPAKRFTESELDYIKKRWKELAAKGMNSWQIAREIAGSLRRNAGSVSQKITQLIEKGELDENPNRREVSATKRFTESELDYIKKRWKELAAKGMNSWQIAREIAGSLRRNAGSVSQKITQLIEKGELDENPNRREVSATKRFTESELAQIKQRWIELAAEGRNKGEIARDIAGSLRRNAGSVSHKITQLIEKGELEKNPNRKETRTRGFFSKMTDDELVVYAKNTIADKGITSRKELQGEDSGLYRTLSKRGLLDRAFSDVDAELAASQHERLLDDIRECFDAYTGDAQ